MSDSEKMWEAIGELTRTVNNLREDFMAAVEPNKARHRALPHRLTAADVRNISFITTRLQPGYHEPDVDAFLDKVEAELELRTAELEEIIAERNRLAEENRALRARLGRPSA